MKAAGESTKKLANDLTSADKGAAKTRANLSTLGNTATKAGLVMVAGAGLAVKAAMDWESAWTGVTKTVNGSAAQMRVLEQGLRGLARTMPESHAQIAAVAEAAGQLGVAQGDILSFTKTMVMLGDTTNLTADEAATSIAQFMNIMQTAPDDVDNLGAALVALGNDGASTERDIIQMAQRIAGAGKIIGASESDILALSNALASVGIDAEAGGSAVSKILIDMSTAVQTNSESLKTWASVSGQTTAEFAANFSQDPVAAFDAFTQGLGRINAEGGDVFTLLEGLGQSDIRVTRAMLGMANSGDLLSKSLATGSREWEKNTALTNEAAKRYDTAAARAQVAWNGIKDNAIDAGNAMLPVVAGIAGNVSSLTSAFGSLPGPVKSSAGVIASVAGVALLAAGGLSKLTVAVAANRAAMASLSTDAPRAAAAIGALGKSLGILTAAYAALKINSKIFAGGGTASVEKYTGAILRLASGGKSAAKDLEALAHVKAPSFAGITITDDLNGLQDAIDTFDASKWEKFTNAGVGTSKLEAAGKVIGQIDAAMASLVQSGSPQEAADMFKYYEAQAKKAGLTSEEAMKQLPGYSAALQGVKNEAKLSGAQVDKFGVSLADTSPEAKKAAEALEAMKQSTRDAAMSWYDFGENLDVAKMSLGDFITDLEDTAKAQANWAENVIKATSRGLDPGFIKNLEDQGASGAKRLAELADASEKEIARVNTAFDSLRGTGDVLAEVMAKVPPTVLTQFKVSGTEASVQKAVDLAHKYNLTPDEVKTVMEALDVASPKIAKVITRMRQLDRIKAMPLISVTDAATGKIRQIQQYIDGMHGKTVRIAVEGGAPGGITTHGADGYVMDYYASGGIRGQRENHIAQIAPAGAWRVWAEPETGGEAYIPFAMSKRKRSQQIAMETVSRLGGVAHFANGGTTGGSSAAPAFDSRLLASALATATERAVTKSLSGATFHMAKDGSIRLKTMRG